ncbi:hypothetical protein IEU95_04425 [Hoyosella rhizosphaerae]|uniref:ESX-1 secretion-associated protein n=1 Tax=Hoyosella rhizosphaerae TaxID=1755582 RepID=A0A916UCC5_9ACTN|nr:type VII secretion target [Hoyosella rhizosphaerae]MBN4926061.1 hypothetical protein [Hoyosella rhizosphaerae]GGC65863.1 hypothetical protein GCM10011410_18010 [Hoyosella rhizosphaerae]
MAELAAHPDDVTRFGTRMADQAERLRALASSVAAVRPEAALTALGPIGSEFLAAYSAAHQRHQAALNAVAAAYQHCGEAAHTASDLYRSADRNAAGTLTNAGSLSR